MTPSFVCVPYKPIALRITIKQIIYELSLLQEKN